MDKRWLAGLAVWLGVAIGAGCAGDQSGGTGRAKPPPQYTGTATGNPGGNAGQSGASGGNPLAADNPASTVPEERTMKIMPDMPTCASTAVTANRVLPSVMLLLDGSSSMDMIYGALAQDAGVPQDGGTAAAPTGPTRWQSVRKALVDPTMGVVPALQGLVRFGVAVFGTTPQCPFPAATVPPALNNYSAVSAAIPFNPPGFFTPTGPALDQIADMLPDPTLALDKVIGPQIIVLATDGEPNACGDGTDPLTALLTGGGGVPPTDYAPSIAAATKAAAKHLKMYVVSVADATGEFADHLQHMANIGAGLDQNANPGAEVYYPTDPTSLADTLQTLIGAELSCDLALDGKGIKPGLECMGHVVLNGNELPCNGADGWELTDETHIRLKGAACDSYKNAVDAVLTADFPCEVIIAL